MSFETQDVVVRRAATVADRIKAFELIPADGSPIRAFAPGGHIIVHLPNNISRHYSLTNAPDETDAYRIAVLDELDGRGGSAFMCNQLNEGMTIPVSGPENNFPLEESARRHLLIAGGIGVTPVLAMAKYLHGNGADFEFHYCAKSAEQAAFVDWLKTCDFADRVNFHFDGGDPSKGLDIKGLADAQDDSTHVYFCGPAGLMGAIEKAFSGWDESRVHSESFVGVDATGENATSFEIEIAGEDKVFTVPADKTILQVLRENGYEIDSVCEEGICGSCIVDVVSGIPEHRDEFLTDEEREENSMLTTCCSRSKSPRLVLEL